jgi:hypothetical protein
MDRPVGLPSAEDIADAAAKAAKQPGGPVPQQAPVYSMPIPPAGSVSGALNVLGLGKYVRLVYVTPGGLQIIDLPVDNGQGQNVAEVVGKGILTAAKRVKSGLVVIGDAGPGEPGEGDTG